MVEKNNGKSWITKNLSETIYINEVATEAGNANSKNNKKD